MRGAVTTVAAREREERSMLALTSYFAGLRARTAREDGQALVEYALILGLVSVVAIAVLAILGSDVTTILGNVTSAMESAI
jgi:pilus assembly protein Flp/PilA